ncbi:phosphonate ABC transporter ATP-binding protein [filamentous cyanobacterium LEGE 11480]|uniref:Phosphonate ABC transporter ATP-binding protein n=1 Tax=Romeriopsis navalis LEGE 11480 TaxID=2777977 RepID=A0A928VS18_9CYAN|nr:phosphonate ABC transporter ATP-binding protein [Romeriopsis navalis]MBE9031059.1 phosphonate ABC transporter ATP-binding protein [Romeriopsis navalis LEGE 11480]
MPTSSSEVIYDLQQVSYQFESGLALENISCQFNRGETVGLIGSSGAGKSTLLKLLNLMLAPTDGALLVFDRHTDQLSLKSRRRLQQQIGTIYQHLHLVDNLQVIHNVNAGNLGRWSWLKALISLVYPLGRRDAYAALERVGIPEKLYERTDQLSGGQQQRVAIARVLMQDPLVLLADEPTASLDRELSQEVMALLCQLCAERGRTLIVSLHDVDLARQYCDRLIGLRQGRLIFDRPTAAVTETMLAQLYQRALASRND